jgi:hypothetical protein
MKVYSPSLGGRGSLLLKATYVKSNKTELAAIKVILVYGFKSPFHEATLPASQPASHSL